MTPLPTVYILRHVTQFANERVPDLIDASLHHQPLDERQAEMGKHARVEALDPPATIGGDVDPDSVKPARKVGWSIGDRAASSDEAKYLNALYRAADIEDPRASLSVMLGQLSRL